VSAPVPPDPAPQGQEGVHRRFLHGAAGKLLAMGIQFGEQFLLVPVFLFFWGRETYGDWLALLSVVGFIGVLDFGLQGYYGSVLQMAWARGDRDGFGRALRQGVAIYAALVLIALPVVALGGLFVPWAALLRLSSTAAGPASTAILLLGLSMLVAVPFGMVTGLYRARGEFALGVFAAILLRLTLLLATATALALGVGPVGLAAVNIGVALLGWIAVLAHQRRRYPDLVWDAERPRGEAARRLATTAPFYAVIPAAATLAVHGTVVLIAGLAGAGAAVVGYTTLRTLTGMARTVTEQVGHVAGAEFARQYAQGDMEALQRLYRFTGRLTGALAGALAGLIAAVGPPFLAIWTLGRVPFSPAVFWPLLAAAALSGPTLAGVALLYFINRPRGLALAMLAGGAVTFGLALALVPHLGAAGAAIAVLASEAAVVGIAVPTMAARVAGMAPAQRIAAGQLSAALAFATSWAAAEGAVLLVGDASLARLIGAGALWAVAVPWPLALVLFNAGQRRWIRDRIAERTR
jgi:O-antigen/teichoic acid export membrane protein